MVLQLILTFFICTLSAYATPLKPLPSTMESRGYYSRPYQSMRVVSFNPYRGDMILDTLGPYSAFKRIRPDLPITVQTYFNDLIVPDSNVHFIKPYLSTILKPEFLMAFYNQMTPLTGLPLFEQAAQAFAEQALVGMSTEGSTLMFFNAFSLYCLFHEELVSRQLVPSDQFAANDHRMWERYLEFKKMVEIQISNRLPAHSLLLSGDLLSDPSVELYESAPFFRHERVNYNFNEFRSLYELSSAIMMRTFGTDGRDLEQPQFFIRFEDEFEFKELLAATFTSPHNGFIILNFNTVGAYKLEALSKYQAELAQELIGFVRKHYPHINIWLTPPELPNGASPQIRTQLAQQHDLIRAIVNRPENRGVVAFLPDNKSFWTNAMRDAILSVSQDSGFVHMSNLSNPYNPYKTFVFSFDGLAHLWAKPSQTVANHMQASAHFFSKKSKLNEAGIFKIKAWLRRELAPQWNPTADAELITESLRLLAHESPYERMRSIFITLLIYKDLSPKQKRAIADTTTEFAKQLPNLELTPELSELIHHLMAIGITNTRHAQLMPNFWDFIWNTKFAYTHLRNYLMGPPYEGLSDLARRFLKRDTLMSLPFAEATEELLREWQADIAEKLEHYDDNILCRGVLVEEK